MTIALLNEMHAKYGSTPSTPVPVQSGREQEPERAFVLEAASGRTVITAPLREVALANEGFMYLRGRFVEADTPNYNGALWTTADLQLGEATVAGGPLNWLHDDTKIVGALMDGQLVTGGRQTAKKNDGDETGYVEFPIHDAAGLAAAMAAVDSSADPGRARKHIKKRAKKLGLPIPMGFDRIMAAAEVGNHIVSTAAMWEFLFPREARVIEKAAADHQLYYSMECLSRTVACVDAPGRPGCGEEFSYGDYDAKRACAHLNARTGVKHFKDPFFLGGAVIVPPARPGWGKANVDVVRQAAAAVEQADLQDVSITQAREVAQAVLQWANRS